MSSGLSRLTAILLAISSAHAAAPEFYLQSKEAIAGASSAHEAMPADADLQKADAILVTKGQWTPEERERIRGYAEKGGGVVLVHDAIPASPWAKGELQRWAGEVPLFFTPPGREDAVTKGVSNFDINDEMFHGLEPEKGSKVLATTWSPNKKHLKGTDPQPYVYGVSPMIWSQEVGKGRVVFFVPGKNAETLTHPAIRAMLRRSLSWSAKRDNVDEFNTKEDLATLVYPPGGPLSPEKSLESLKVHPDFKVNLVAAEPLISKPLNLDWDAQGRLWVVESLEYPEGKEGGGPESMYAYWDRDSNLVKPAPVNRPGRDRITMLEDTNGDGVMDSKKVFADDLDLATAFCFYRDGVIVGQAPEILYLRDADHDGRAETRTVLYKGLGTSDRHAVINNFRWGLDGWIYATHGYAGSRQVTSGDGSKDFGAINSGIVRFKPDGSAIEMVSAKSGNCWGVDMTTDGELIFTQPTSGDLVMHVPVSDRIMAEGGLGREPSWQVMVHLRPVKPLMSWEEIVENQPNDVIGSFTAACGCAVYEGGAWPDVWKMGYFTAEPTVHIIHHEALTPDGPTYSAAKTREEEFSATRDFWTRPIDTRVGPDGQLYVIDFYNQAILHNDPRGPIHLWYNQAARPDRDHYFGRIQRYSHKESKPLPKAELTTLDGQIAALSHPNRDIRFRAQRLIEEGDLKTAANRLGDAKGVARLHALWIRSAAGVLKSEELISAIGDSDLALRVTVGRVIGAHPELATAPVLEELGRRLPGEADARVRLQWLAGLPADAALPAEVLVALQAKSDDRWTRAAIARLARKQPAQVLAAALASGEADKQAGLAAQLFDAFSGDAAVLPAMLEAIAKSGGKSPQIAVASLASLRGRKLPASPKLGEVMEQLAASNSPQIAAAALPLSAVPANPAKVEEAVKRILAVAPQDSQVLASLGNLPVLPAALIAALKDGLTRESPQRGAILDTVLGNVSGDATKLTLAVLPSLPAGEKAKAIEALLGRPASAMALSDALNDGSLSVQVTGTPVLARLADHPDAAVKEHAAPMLKRLRGAVEAKDAVIARLLPEVSKPGNPEAGKALFASCAVCHNFRGEGALIGPVLEGIGVHSVEALLTHIVDPNREVEPSYHVWNISTTDGRSLSGFVSRETEGSLFIKSAGGETEIPRAQIASRTDTGKSLMPEGFEGLGADTLRDLIAYLRSGEQRFHTLPFGKAATADGSRGVYLSHETPGDQVSLKKYGLVEERGVPFQLQDPATAPDGKNVIVLKGGMDPRAVSKTMPQRVEIPVGLAAGRIHLLGAVAGWGFPAANDRDPLVEITVYYSGGSSEKIVLRNGIDFADHAGRIDVAGSAWADQVKRGQIRYLWRDLKQPAATIEKIVLASADRPAAPMIAAITFESADKDGKMKPAPAEGGPLPSDADKGDAKSGARGFSDKEFVLPANTQRVLLAGGGGSHDFGAWYDSEDRKILTEAGGLLPYYTSSPEDAAAQLPNTDVFLFSSNDPAYPKSEAFRKAFDAYVARGGGLVLLHPATWYNWPDWPAYNTSFVGGGSRAHDPLGEFTLTVIKPEHPVVAGLSKEFKIRDEHYQINFEPGAKTETLIETSVSAQTGKKHPSVWITAHPKCRIVCIAPGHDGAVHRNPEFRRLLVNAVKWAGGK
ncbi:PVC-type heme-binding CxxCH protein [Haloferula sp. BvORR071]|uniref:PVC-type heme-binding CxxCH protein n=1 Tax=Haloferula sp. BvORR071 TaxID=1396141 RepID=UPI0005504A52|nr:PVC-type heme-binding CxxCH protein [Haloferula sp. BvORR071]